MDLFKSPEIGDLASQQAVDAKNEAASALASRPQVSTLTGLKLAAQGTITGEILSMVADRREEALKEFTVDSTWTAERAAAARKEAAQFLPEEYLDTLSGSISKGHFDRLFSDARQHAKDADELARAGWTANAANMILQFADPITLATGSGTAALAMKASRLAQLGRTGQIAMNALGGAAGGVGMEYEKELVGLPTSASGYAMAAGIGMALGGVLGPVARNPVLAREASAIRDAGESLEKQLLLEYKPRPTEPPKVIFGEGPAGNLNPVDPTDTQAVLDHLEALRRSGKFMEKPQGEVPTAPAEPSAPTRIDPVEPTPAPAPPVPPEVEPHIKAVMDDLRRILPPEVAINLEDQATSPLWAMWEAGKRTITLAKSDINGKEFAWDKIHQFGWHESVHALRDLGLLTEDEWSALVAHASKSQHIPKDMLERYRPKFESASERLGFKTQEARSAFVEERLNHERVAFLAEQWARGKSFGPVIDGLMKKVSDIIKMVRSAFSKHPEIEEIFKKINSGEVAARAKTQGLAEITGTEYKIGAEQSAYRAAQKAEAKALADAPPSPGVIHTEGPVALEEAVRETTKRGLAAKAEEFKRFRAEKAAKSEPAAPPAHTGEMDPMALLQDGQDDVLRGHLGGLDVAALKAFVKEQKLPIAPGVAKTLKTVDDWVNEIMAKLYNRFDDLGGTVSARLPDNENFLKDPTWAGIAEEDAAKTFWGKWRYSQAGRLGSSVNAAARLIGNHLLNDTVGKVGHKLNQLSADLFYRQYTEKMMTRMAKVFRPAYDEWADSQGWSPAKRLTNRQEFSDQVDLYIRDRHRGVTNDYHPAVAKAGNQIAALMGETLERLKNPLMDKGLVGRSVHGAEWVPEDVHYMWRQFSKAKVLANCSDKDGFGQEGVIKMIAGAIKSAQPEISDKLLQKLAKGYLMSLHSRAAGIGDEWASALSRKDRGLFERVLRDTSGANMSDAEIEEVLKRMKLFQPEGANGNLKRRVLLDETYVERGLPHATKGTSDLAFRDLLNTDVESLFNHYTRRAAGRIALGNVRITLENGKVLVDGITKDSEIDGILENIRKYGADRGQYTETEDAVTRLRFAFDRILGHPNPEQQSNFAQWARLMRQYMSMRLMGQVGISQFGETGSAIGVMGWKSALQRMPGYRRILDAAGDIRNSNPIYEELENIGIGGNNIHGFTFHAHSDDLEALSTELGARPLVDRLMDWGRAGENLTYKLSGMNAIQAAQELWTASIMASKFAQIGAKVRAGQALSKTEARRMSQLGLSEKQLGKIWGQLSEHSDVTNGAFFDKKINRLNLNNWTDLSARADFEAALFRATRKIIQTSDEGSAAMFMSNPIWQTIFQFRNYAMTAWDNQLIHNIHMGDPAALSMFTTSVAWSATVRAAQVQLLAAGRSDAESYKEKHLSAWELGKAGFQRSGWSSNLPMVFDSGLALMGQPGQFNARTTGQASQAILGSPVMSAMDSAAKGLGGVFDSLTRGRSLSQAEAREAFGLLPWNKLPGLSNGFAYLVRDMPEKAPKAKPWEF